MAVVAEDEHPGYMTAADIIRNYGTTRAYVYKLANAHKWRRYRLDGQLRYHAGDVDDVLGKDPKRPSATGVDKSRPGVRSCR